MNYSEDKTQKSADYIFLARPFHVLKFSINHFRVHYPEGQANNKSYL